MAVFLFWQGAGGFYYFVLNILNHTAKRTYKATALMTYSSQGELITFRYRGLHTGPSASDKNMDTPFGVSIFLAGAKKC